METAGFFRKTGVIRAGSPVYEKVPGALLTKVQQRRRARMLLGHEDWATSE
jgi:hypothetical protein